MDNANPKNDCGPIASTIEPSNQSHQAFEIITENGISYPVVPCLLDPPGTLVFWCAHCRSWHNHGAGGEDAASRLKVGEIVGHRVAHCANRPIAFARGYFLRLAKVLPDVGSSYSLTIGELTPVQQRHVRETTPHGRTVVSLEQARGVASRLAEVDSRYAAIKWPSESLTMRLSDLGHSLAWALWSESGDRRGFTRCLAETKRLVLNAAKYLP